ncbi:MAG: hypothetical protein KatS3mg097_147 [Candidatus Parcubacteria bacterium]|nr:MAG: hypothetical protein KatS3mg097_147 [Candidatus Parcubacteria bacterium]
MLSNILNFIKKSFNELKKVNWLSSYETLRLTGEVIVFSLIFAIIYGIVDALLVGLLFK